MLLDPLARFTELENAFNAAMISNNIAQISACISDDWTLVTPEVGPVSRERILLAISSGDLVHDTMTKQIVRAEIYGDVAVVTGRGQNTGWFKGSPITADEWITDVYHRRNDRWLCVLTHLTPAAQT